MKKNTKQVSGLWGRCLWTIKNGILTVSRGSVEGTASDREAPWEEYKESITAVWCSDEVTASGGDSFKGLFSGCSNLTYADFDNFDFTGVASLESMFEDCEALRAVTINGATTCNVSSMRSMFKNCRLLETVNFRDFDVSSVEDMSGMFSGCERLSEADISLWKPETLRMASGMFMNCIRLESVIFPKGTAEGIFDAGYMFCGCGKLRIADFSDIEMPALANMSGMFMNCISLEYFDSEGLKAPALMLADGMFENCSSLRTLDLSGFGELGGRIALYARDDCRNLSSVFTGAANGFFHQENGWECTPEYIYFRRDAAFTVRYMPNGGNGKMVEDAFSAGEDVQVRSSGFPFTGKAVFKDWNTKKDGLGKSFIPGGTFGPLFRDIVLYATYGGEPQIRDIHIPDMITYGSRLTEYESLSVENRKNIDRIFIEISKNGQTGWKQFPAEFIIPVSLNGYFVRFCAVNSLGKGYSEKQRLTINKADYDMKGVEWKKPQNLVYDGTVKTVELINVPEGLTVRCEGNRAIDAGTYVVTAEIEYDSDNYNRPPDIPDLRWEIEKADYDFSDVEWDYNEYSVLTYDGTKKSVKLTGLPDGVIPVYEKNSAVDSGKYSASVSLYYDVENYNMPPQIPPCEWEIHKAQFDMRRVRWDAEPSYEYDGEVHEVTLTGLPEELSATYEDNRAIGVGSYTARAFFSSDNSRNYYIPDGMTFTFDIVRGKLDFSRVHWDYTGPFLCDRTEKEVKLSGVPEGVTVEYSGNTASSPGEYSASAVFVYDFDNYERSQVDDLVWEIKKSEYDLSGVHWDYSKPYIYSGNEFSVQLLGLKDDLEVIYTGNRGTDAGTYTAAAEISVDEEIYIRPEKLELEWRIEKFSPDVSHMRWDYESPFVFDGVQKSVELLNVPDFISVTYEGNTAADAGIYQAEANFTASDSENISAEGSLILSWEIKKAEIDMSGVCWDEQNSFVYDGTEKTIRLMNVPEQVEVDYSGCSAVSAGLYGARATFYVKDEKNYVVPAPVEHRWMIEKAEYDMEKVRWSETDDFRYDGTEKSVELLELPEGVTASYVGNSAVDAGLYKATAVLEYDTDNYNAPFVKQYKWRIKRAEIHVNDLEWDYEGPFVFDGEVKKIELLDIPRGISVEYLSNEASAAGNYVAEAFLSQEKPENYSISEKITCRWEIERKQFDMSSVRWDSSGEFVYTGDICSVHLINVPAGLEVKYNGNQAADAGRYEAVAEFVPEDVYNTIIPESRILEWKIKKATLQMDNMFWSSSRHMVYDGSVKSVMLNNVPDILKVIYHGNEAIKAGRYEAHAGFVLREGNNYIVPDPVSHLWTIEKDVFNMSSCTWVNSDEMVYNGKSHEVYLEGIPEGVSCEYENNCKTDAGEYMASARFSVSDSENFYVPDSMVHTFRIEKARLEMPELIWDYSGREFEYDGTEKNVSLKETPYGATVKYSGNRGTDAGRYVARAEFIPTNPDNYCAPEPVECEWGISKKMFDMKNVRWDNSSIFTYDGTEKTVELVNVPEGITPVYSNNKAVNAGTYIASVKFNVDDENCETPHLRECSWRIFKATLDIDNISWGEKKLFTYDGEVKSVMLEGIPEGMQVEYSGNEYSDVGSYTATAELIPDDPNNYYKPVVQFCKWEIKKASYDLSSMEWQEETEFRYDGSEKKVVLTGVPEGIIPHYYGNAEKRVGKYTASAAFEYDIRNYNKPVFKELSWSIVKAGYDMSDVRWVRNENFIYDGREKTVMLEGLPEGIVPIYSGNREKNAGIYTASAILQYDSYNYEKPEVDSYVWEIQRARIDTIGIEWNYIEPFEYDGSEKSVELTGIFAGEGMINRLMNMKAPVNTLALPRGTTVKYENERAVNAGDYCARAYIVPPDENNYEEPSLFVCSWSIRKGKLDLSETAWDYEVPFEYDGSEKSVELVNVPDEVEEVIYHGNCAEETGTYTARAEFVLKEDGNYRKPEDRVLTWRISKRTLDFSNVRWDYTEPFMYDGEVKNVELTGLPEEVSVEYINSSKTERGTYTAAAVIVYDAEKYIVSSVDDLTWHIL